MKIPSEVASHRAPTQNLSFHLPFGLIGFRHLTHFELSPVEGSEPFQVLRSLGEQSLEFIVVEPVHVVKDYQIALRDEDVESLRLDSPGDALVLNIVVIHAHDPQYVTVNLVGPILINRLTLIGQQVLIANSSEFSVEHVLVDQRS
jgi:flagellar assembly factor FliW